VLPQIVFSLQNMELYHHAEKRLLAARSIIEPTFVRELSLRLNSLDAQQIAFLNGNVLRLLDRLGMPHCPAAGVRPATEPAGASRR
jgi:4-hydroxy-tetrahydrodipicolinate synthase